MTATIPDRKKPVSARCNLCGRFQKKEDLLSVWGEGNDVWLECSQCVSQADFNRYFKNKNGTTYEKEGE